MILDPPVVEQADLVGELHDRFVVGGHNRGDPVAATGHRIRTLPISEEGFSL